MPFCWKPGQDFLRRCFIVKSYIVLYCPNICFLISYSLAGKLRLLKLLWTCLEFLDVGDKVALVWLQNDGWKRQHAGHPFLITWRLMPRRGKFELVKRQDLLECTCGRHMFDRIPPVVSAKVFCLIACRHLFGPTHEFTFKPLMAIPRLMAKEWRSVSPKKKKYSHHAGCAAFAITQKSKTRLPWSKSYLVCLCSRLPAVNYHILT